MLRIQAVVDAWAIEGPKPRLHNKAKRKLNKEWATLAYSLNRLTEAWHIYPSHRGRHEKDMSVPFTEAYGTFNVLPTGRVKIRPPNDNNI